MPQTYTTPQFSELEGNGNIARPRNSCSQFFLKLKDCGLTAFFSGGKLIQHIGNQQFGNSLGNRYLHLPDSVNRVSSNAFLASGLVVTVTTRVYSLYQKAQQWCNCSKSSDNSANEPLLNINNTERRAEHSNQNGETEHQPPVNDIEQNNPNNNIIINPQNKKTDPKNYQPKSKSECGIYYGILISGYASGAFSTLNSLLAAMLVYANLTQDKAVVHPEDITPSAGLMATAAYVSLCSATTFYSFKLEKIKKNAILAGQRYSGQKHSILPSSYPLTCWQHSKKAIAYISAVGYTLGFGIFSKAGTESAILSLIAVFNKNAAHSEQAQQAINAISWLSAIPALSTTFFTAGRNLIHIAHPDDNQKPITLKPQKWSCINLLLFTLIALSGLIDTYANTIGFFGSTHDALQEVSSLEEDHLALLSIAWMMAAVSILPYWALNGAESLDAVFGSGELAKEDSELLQEVDTASQSPTIGKEQFKMREFSESHHRLFENFAFYGKTNDDFPVQRQDCNRDLMNGGEESHHRQLIELSQQPTTSPTMQG